MDLRLSFDKDNKGEIERNIADAQASDDIKYHEGNFHMRSVRFVDIKGVCKTFGYSQLVDQTYDPKDGTLVLNFGASTVTLSGKNLDKLDVDFSFYKPYEIKCFEKRYAATRNENDITVTEVLISANE